MIFETERLLIRALDVADLNAFHTLESNAEVLKYATGSVKTLAENKIELTQLINNYKKTDNTFFIYAIERKLNATFIGTVALVKDGKDDEIGYRLIKEYWQKGYGLEVCKGLILYCKQLKMQKLIGYVIDENIASKKILEKLNFTPIAKLINKDLQLPETKYQYIL